MNRTAGQVGRVSEVCEGQEATVLQLPAQPMTETEVEQQKRAEYIG